MAELTIQQAFDLGVKHHRAGRLQEAEQLYRRILAAQPDHAEALHHLGVIAYQAGKHQIAVELIRQVILLRPDYAEAHNNLGNALKDQGQLDEAISAYRRAIALRPNYPQAHSNLGNALQDKGELAEAIDAHGRAIGFDPSYAEAHNNLGNALNQSGRFDEAIAAFTRAIVLRPDFAQAHGNLASVLKNKGRLDEAAAAYRRAIALNPNSPQAYNNLGNLLKEQGQFDEAIAAYRQAISLQPGVAQVYSNLGNALRSKGQLHDAIAAYRRAIGLDAGFAHAHSNLGIALQEIGQLDEAIAAFGRAIALDPAFPQAQSNLSSALRDKGRFDEAISAAQKALALNPNLPQAHNNLGNALKDKGQLDEAIAAYRRAILIDPKYAEAHNNLGNALKDGCQIEAAIAAYREAIAIDPASARRDSNLLYALHFQPGRNAESIAEEHRRWNRQYAQPLAQFTPKHGNDLDPDRRLRIAYVSPDFRRHSVSFFLLPLLQSRDRARFHVTCYATSGQRDAVTDQIQSSADHWACALGESDEVFAQRIAHGQIDILIDLAGHTGFNRLLVFARKPAPVQVTYLGYPNTTGLTAIDWRLTDSIADPAGTEALHSEKLFRLPRTAWCFNPLSGSPPIQPRENGPVVFGCFNDSAKINAPLLALWARVMQQAADSRLLLKNRAASAASVRQWLRRQLEAGGIAWDRVELLPPQPNAEDHLRCYDRIDIALDTYPYHGTTTTCEALWMGVPVVTLAGQSHVRRVGASLLTSAGLPDLIAEDADGYIQRALQLAGDADRRRELRATLRERMRHSPLMDAAAFAGNIEAAYRQMWQEAALRRFNDHS